MTGPVVIEVPLPGPALSPNARGHWSKRYKAAQVLADWVIVGAREASFPGGRTTIDPAVVSYHVRWCGRAPDGDNFVASMIPGLNALVREGILVDDSPEHVTSIEVTYERVATRKAAGVRITVAPA